MKPTKPSVFDVQAED
jgi:hypothetical protein